MVAGCRWNEDLERLLQHNTEQVIVYSHSWKADITERLHLEVIDGRQLPKPGHGNISRKIRLQFGRFVSLGDLRKIQSFKIADGVTASELVESLGYVWSEPMRAYILPMPPLGLNSVEVITHFHSNS